MSETPQATSKPRKLPPPLKSSSRVGAAMWNNNSPFMEDESDNAKSSSVSLLGRKSLTDEQLQEIEINEEIEELKQKIDWLETKKRKLHLFSHLLGKSLRRTRSKELMNNFKTTANRVSTLRAVTSRKRSRKNGKGYKKTKGGTKKHKNKKQKRN